MTKKREAGFHEGGEAAWRFKHAIGQILRVSKTELTERETKYQESRKHRSRPGPKPKKSTV